MIISSYVGSAKTDQEFVNGCQSLSLIQNTQAEMPVYEVAFDSVRDTKYADADLYNTVDGDQTNRLSPNEYETFKSSVSRNIDMQPSLIIMIARYARMMTIGVGAVVYKNKIIYTHWFCTCMCVQYITFHFCSLNTYNIIVEWEDMEWESYIECCI